MRVLGRPGQLLLQAPVVFGNIFRRFSSELEERRGELTAARQTTFDHRISLLTSLR
jgi:hypothetical protein